MELRWLLLISLVVHLHAAHREDSSKGLEKTIEGIVKIARNRKAIDDVTPTKATLPIPIYKRPVGPVDLSHPLKRQVIDGIVQMVSPLSTMSSNEDSPPSSMPTKSLNHEIFKVLRQFNVTTFVITTDDFMYKAVVDESKISFLSNNEDINLAQIIQDLRTSRKRAFYPHHTVPLPRRQSRRSKVNRMLIDPVHTDYNLSPLMDSSRLNSPARLMKRSYRRNNRRTQFPRRRLFHE